MEVPHKPKRNKSQKQAQTKTAHLDEANAGCVSSLISHSADAHLQQANAGCVPSLISHTADVEEELRCSNRCCRQHEILHKRMNQIINFCAYTISILPWFAHRIKKSVSKRAIGFVALFIAYSRSLRSEVAVQEAAWASINNHSCSCVYIAAQRCLSSCVVHDRCIRQLMSLEVLPYTGFVCFCGIEWQPAGQLLPVRFCPCGGC